MNIRNMAERIGFQVVGELRRCTGLEPSHLYLCFLDEASNRYILRRGILTIVAAGGDTVYLSSRNSRQHIFRAAPACI